MKQKMLSNASYSFDFNNVFVKIVHKPHSGYDFATQLCYETNATA